MKFIDRFIDFWGTLDHKETRYNLCLFEQIVYGVLGMLIGVLFMFVSIVLVTSSPIWIVPYIIYIRYKINKKKE